MRWRADDSAKRVVIPAGRILYFRELQGDPAVD